ncbi:hypothetical protein C1H46_018049 [Malus baccata]|uniref:alanine--tRNA ligase n=1 Tax=Malus baccata TaxID=106549 RepID=A0A540MC16_MALBA|nr:hypothetical protein C1H46_018049 [Malus baccata]
MLQFKPVFLDPVQVPRQVPRATTAQRCIRTNDVENGAIQWAWELSTVEFGLPANRLWISVFEEDNEAFEICHDEMGVPVERIKRMGEEDNFWTSGVAGPCGPCSEIYYDFHPERGYADIVSNNYETDLIYPIIEKTSELAKVPYDLADDQSKLNLKIIGDHMRAVVYLISGGVVPSNIGRGYVVRRLIRRAVRTGRILGTKGDLSTDIYPDVKDRMPRIF